MLSGRLPGRAHGPLSGRAAGRLSGRARGRAHGRLSGRTLGHLSGRAPGRLAASALLLLAAVAAPTSGSAQSLAIDKVEPMNWWAGMTLDTLQLMVYGQGLDGVTARFLDDDADPARRGAADANAGGARPEVVAVHPAASPGYAFVQVHLPDDLEPGTYTLELRKDGEARTVEYPIRERAPRAGRHQGFGPEDVVYLVMPDRFANAVPENDAVPGFPDEHDRSDPGARHGGDLLGIIERLDYLADLGVTALWLNPVLENRAVGTYHGYAATDLYRIDPRLGTNEDYRRLVEEAHRRGLKVIFDHISNHIGVEHPWLEDLPTETWLHGSVEDHLLEKHYMLSIADPYAPAVTEEMLKSFWFVSGMPDLNQRDPFLADYLIQNTIWWIEYTGLDGIREDTYPYPDQAFLAEWAETILEEYPDFNIVGEIWSGEPAFTALFQKDSPLPRDFETNLPSVMDFALSDAWRAYIQGHGTLQDAYSVLAQDFLYADPDQLMTFVDNHDMARALYIAGGDTRKVKQALTMLLTTRGIPQILYGTEVAMIGGESHVELRANMPGGWPGDERSVFDPAQRTALEAEMFEHLRTLLHLRKRHPALTRGELTHFPPTWNDDTYVYLRSTDEETILVAVNGYEDDRRIDVEEVAPHLPAGATLVDLVTGEAVALDPATGLPVGGWDARVFRVE